jgi:hypothetical protein
LGRAWQGSGTEEAKSGPYLPESGVGGMGSESDEPVWVSIRPGDVFACSATHALISARKLVTMLCGWCVSSLPVDKEFPKHPGLTSQATVVACGHGPAN